MQPLFMYALQCDYEIIYCYSHRASMSTPRYSNFFSQIYPSKDHSGRAHDNSIKLHNNCMNNIGTHEG